MQAADYQAKVTSAKRRTVSVAAERGRILDAEGRVVADNKRILTVTIEWSMLRRKANRASSCSIASPARSRPRCSTSCAATTPATTCPIRAPRGSASTHCCPCPLKEGVDEEVVAFLKERSEDYPGVDVVEQYRPRLSVCATGSPCRRVHGGHQ